ncbi:E3 ubiquitin-protein ligase UBR3 [Fasciola hepatica]|uniref:E3 ubiquitin-protein ligase n=1 Tax=Fasciola hepatica TaxID=6192 RepID=A0A4E0REY3_FASHE|nr:E3 ubiquitin-protein ligase UBR3 [Fasciola hepatica]
MDFFDLPDAELKDADDFMTHVSNRHGLSKEAFRSKFCDACTSGNRSSSVFTAVMDIFSYDGFTADRYRMKKARMNSLTKFFEYLIAGDIGIETMGRKCSSCFTAGNHVGHDFNKFKSLAGGACDCGDSSVMKESGYCRYHGPDKINNRPSPPEELVAPLRCLLPRFLPALLYSLWDLCSCVDPTNLTDEVAPPLFVLHVLHACGWVTQKMIADVLIDRNIFDKLRSDCADTTAYKDYQLSVATNPGFSLPEIIRNQELSHRTLLDAFIFCTIKLRFPESLVTFLIGLLAVDEFKEEFVQSYLNHYTRIASTVMISARTRMVTEWSLQMNNRIVHISVQLFSGEDLALRMVRERNLHYLLVHCLLNMCICCRTRLDDRSNMVVNCDGPLIQNNVFWPFVSDLGNLVSHKSIVDVFVEDDEFLNSWTEVLRYMQFMNCFVMKEGNHIEYETMAFYHAITLEIEISANLMWNIWQHYRHPSERDRCVRYLSACLSCLGSLLGDLGRLFSPTPQGAHPMRSPLSFHLPLMRHVACFLSLAVMQHGADLSELLSSFLYPRPYLLRRFMNELANTLLGCQEVIVGYWIRNGQSLRQSITHYMQSQLCYSFIDLDIFALQVCATLLPPAYLLNALVDETRLLRGLNFHEELMNLVAPVKSRSLDRKPMALEAWLVNLCWVLDLRNNICLTEDELLKKELLCILAPEPRKRSDLSSLIPERCGINSSPSSLDELLKTVATYSAPTCDEASGSLISGHYYLRPSLWHTDFDPIFHSLRVTSRRETAVAMEKYRDHCRQRHGVVNPSTLWPPYRIPKPLPSNFLGLDHVLHSRHLHYLIFIQLSMFVYGDPIVTEDSLSMVVHLLDRALDTPCRQDARGRKCCVHAYNNRPILTEPMQIDDDDRPTSSQNRSARLGADDELTECTGARNNALDDFSYSDALGIENDVSDVDHDDMDDEDEELHSSLAFFLNDLAWPIAKPGESSTPGQPDDFSRKRSKPRGGQFRYSPQTMRPPQWNSSLRNCPYQPRTGLHDNLGCWLIVRPTPYPHVALAPTMLATQTHPTLSNRDPVVSVIPSLSSPDADGEKSSVLVDSILSLLVKAHARLHWSRVSGSADAIPKVAVGDRFADPNAAASQLSNAGGSSRALDELNVLEQVQGNNTESSYAARIAPRCVAVLGVGDNGSFTSLNSVWNVSNNVVSELSAANITTGQAAPTAVSGLLTPETIAKLPPELRYFAAGPPAYLMSDERSLAERGLIKNSTYSAASGETIRCPDHPSTCCDDAENKQFQSCTQSKDFGDGAFWIERLLDKIASRSHGNETALRLYLTRARQPFAPTVRILRLQPLDTFSSMQEDTKDPMSMNPYAGPMSQPITAAVSSEISLGPNSVLLENSSLPSPNAVTLSTPTPGAAAATREERKRAAFERRKRLMEQMASKQKAFASTHLKDMELLNQPADGQQDLVENTETVYECVICQTCGKPSSEDMVLLDMMCESGIMLHVRETPTFPELFGRQLTHAYGMATEMPLEREAFSLVAQRPPVSQLDSKADPLSDTVACKTTMAPASSSGLAPTGTVGVSVLSTSFDPTAPFQTHPPAPIPTCTTPTLNPLLSSPSPQADTSVHGPVPAGSLATGSSTTLTGPPSLTNHVAPYYLESRRWWSLALPSTLGKHLPLLRSGLLLQTCGHVVHRECFQRYRAQAANRTGPARNRNWFPCPLCRRDVHHLLPLIPTCSAEKERLMASGHSRSAQEHINTLINVLASLNPTGKSLWDDLNGAEDESTMEHRNLMSALIGDRFEATVLLRSQLECELAVLMSCPSQYQIVSRRCAWREFLCYLRRLYKYATDLQNCVHCLTDERAPFNADDTGQGEQVFALCQDPGDVLLSLMPHVWPREDLFLTLVSATFCLAYVRALLSALVNCADYTVARCGPKSPSEIASALVKKVSGPLASHIQHLIPYIQALEPVLANSIAVSDANDASSESERLRSHQLLRDAACLSEVQPLTESASSIGSPSFGYDQSLLEMRIVLRVLPLLRLAGLCRARWQANRNQDQAPTVSGATCGGLTPMGLPFVGQLITSMNLTTNHHPLSPNSSANYTNSDSTRVAHANITDEQRLLEFSDLCRTLSLDCGDTTVAVVAQVAQLAASRSGLYPSTDSDGIHLLSSRWFRQMQMDESSSSQTKQVVFRTSTNQSDSNSADSLSIERLPALIEIGRQLYPPRLIRTPYSFDALFNALHVVSCDAVQHRFQENALCLICGRLLCTICTKLPTAMIEHAFTCEGFAGVMLEVNSSIVYVSLGPNMCDWGSVYLDAYGEEDLELRRGKPLFLNAERFALLENQWLSHSFRHVLKHWRLVSL